MAASLNVNLTLIHGCSVMVPTRIDKSWTLHNAILLGIQFNYLDQFTGGGGRYFSKTKEISQSVIWCTYVSIDWKSLKT